MYLLCNSHTIPRVRAVGGGGEVNELTMYRAETRSKSLVRVNGITCDFRLQRISYKSIRREIFFTARLRGSSLIFLLYYPLPDRAERYRTRIALPIVMKKYEYLYVDKGQFNVVQTIPTYKMHFNLRFEERKMFFLCLEIL